MTEVLILDPHDELDDYIEAFEVARRENPGADFTGFLPPPDHPLYRDVLRELIRVDLEFGWESGQPQTLCRYRAHFPLVFANPEDFQAIAFEEYRLRRQAGEDPAPEEYYKQYGVDTRNWPNNHIPPRPQPVDRTVRTLVQPARVVVAHADSPSYSAGPLSEVSLPDVGGEFLGFQVVAEIGRGAFGRVYLAKQGELADRPVVLKVTRDGRGESRLLARLQHTNIVPIHSVHRADRLHAICMPYLGATTLSDLLRALQSAGPLPSSGRALIDTFNTCRASTRGLSSQTSLTFHSPLAPEQPAVPGVIPDPSKQPKLPALEEYGSRSYVEVILWIGARLAAGLAHAHERGVLHCDLKPANVLLADDGQPMLLDFNLSKDATLPADAPPGHIGGTLPYMAPEHLMAFKDRSGIIDARSDVYGLGVLLYELLSGRLPYPILPGSIRDIVPSAIANRLEAPHPLRELNPAVSPAVQAIIGKCLEPEPTRRYQSAGDLRDDIERQLQNLPLRHTREPSLRERAGKWVRRHPKLSSGTSVGIIAGIFLLALAGMLVLRSQRLARIEAAECYNRFHEELRDARVLFLDAPTGQVAPSIVLAATRKALERYHVLEDPGWFDSAQVRRLPTRAREQLRNEAVELLLLQASVSRLQADTEKDKAAQEELLGSAADFVLRAEKCFPADRISPAVWYEKAALATQLHQEAEAISARQKGEAALLQTAQDRCMVACVYMSQGRDRLALPYWEAASRLEPGNLWMWYGLAVCYDRLNQRNAAEACYTACIALDSQRPIWYARRGLALLKQDENARAEADFSRVIDLGSRLPEIYVNRGLARLNVGRAEDAVNDFSRGLELGGADPRLYLMRAKAREKAGDHEGAKLDRIEAMNREPMDENGYIARGKERVEKEPELALADFERALTENPRSLDGLSDKAYVLSEKLGRTAEAVRVLDLAVKIYPEYARARISCGVLQARLGNEKAALKDASTALADSRDASLEYQAAGIYALTSRGHPERCEEAVKLLSDALRHGVGHDRLLIEKDLDPIRADPAFLQLAEAVRLLKPAPSGAGTTPVMDPK